MARNEASADDTGPQERKWANRLEAHMEATGRLLARVAAECGPSLEDAIDTVAVCLRAGGKLMVCGNGGSAADSQHVASELTWRLTSDFRRPAMAAVALTTDTSFMTAYANDAEFDGIFARQVEAVGRPGDALLGISTSGSSSNVLRAFEAARKQRITTVALVGQGGRLATEADRAIVIPSRVTAHIQEAMLGIEHVLCHALERELFAD